MENKLPDIH